MYAQVQLLNGFSRPLWYKIPDEIVSVVQVGSVVRVPLQLRKESALVTSLFKYLPKNISFQVKPIDGLERVPDDKLYRDFTIKIARYYQVKPLLFFQRIRHFLKEKEKKAVLCDLEKVDLLREKKITLTGEQQQVVDYLTPFVTTPSYQPVLLHGVTGSGKTEVYKRLIEQAIAENKTVLLMLPEVSLAMQFEHLLKKQLPSITIIGFHSATKITEKRLLWQMLTKQQPLLIIGVHLPVLLPIPNLGLIIVDEEHEQGYREKKHPKIHSKEIALFRAHHYNIPILLGSATPSLTSLHNVTHKDWKFFQIKKRFAGSFPAVEKIILTEKEGKRRKSFWVSRQLEDAVRETLAKNEQVMIFLNRRGYSFFVQCKSCGFLFECRDCSVSLTLHQNPVQSLRCHYCDYHIDMPNCCPECKAPEKELLKKGIGTQQLVKVFQEIFPSATIERADLDSTSKKRSWKKTVEDFKAGSIDMLIGTQTITKGYDFPGVTLVGILWADLNLHFPLYNASESSLQQLIQVAGRAGRHRQGSRVIVQTMHDHKIYDYISEQDYLTFCKDELEVRKESLYPPYGRLVHVELKHASEAQINQDAEKIADQLRLYDDKHKLDVRILGPAMPLISRVQNSEIRHIVLKSQSFKNLHKLLRSLEKINVVSSIYVVMG